MSMKAFDDAIDEEAGDWEFTSVDAADKSILHSAEVACEEADWEIGVDDAYHDIAVNMLSVMEPQVRADFARCQLGWDPEFDRDLYEQHGINPELAE
jgi:hypothetical protein